ncbi:capsular polysaccharide biosynthesis protein [Lentisphaera araneosa HTCC2155]|jgi:transmembrane protein EpsG|uniref:Capsular polysaccharide biosynthesis protein n=1 Tax=Lentisphaera araneosa HTCC2155 TaxID=313628 RepID=A6DHG2_9BACT|nr:EpsG family protein [Lentisphaera araneosa]EDM29045.1 capsular polysaccharide biosynthesis protein [Lentisphaera araneosa HTCC2155]
MIPIFCVLFSTTFLTYFAQKNIPTFDQDGIFLGIKLRKNKFLLILIQAILILFIGLRKGYNDTYAYIKKFSRLDTGWDALLETNWKLSENPGFYILNTLIKTYISDNPQVFLFIYALASIGLIFYFYQRWSQMLWLTVFLFIASGTFLASMAAIKQIIAMGIGLLGVHYYLTKRPYKFIACILLGCTFHPYLIFFLGAFFLSNRVWSKKVTLIILGAVLSGFLIEQFIQIAYSTTNELGYKYEKHGEVSGKGMNILRFLVYCTTPTLTWVYRKKINQSQDKALILFSNFTLIGWCFMFISLFIGANMFGRMAMYFDPFMHLTLTVFLTSYLPIRNQSVVKCSCVLSYTLFFTYEIYSRGFIY